MLRPAWLICVELQGTRQVSLKQVEELTERLAKASEKSQSLKESKTLYQRYLEEELPRGKRMLDEKTSAVTASITELKQHSDLDLQQIAQDLAELKRKNVLKVKMWKNIFTALMTGDPTQVQT